MIPDWSPDKYQKVAESVKQLKGANSDIIPAKYKITYKSLTQENCSVYWNFVESNLWEPVDNTK